jgi:hypothetical protein
MFCSETNILVHIYCNSWVYDRACRIFDRGTCACRTFDPGTYVRNIALANMSQEADHPCRCKSTSGPVTANRFVMYRIQLVPSPMSTSMCRVFSDFSNGTALPLPWES